MAKNKSLKDVEQPPLPTLLEAREDIINLHQLASTLEMANLKGVPQMLRHIASNHATMRTFIEQHQNHIGEANEQIRKEMPQDLEPTHYPATAHRFDHVDVVGIPVLTEAEAAEMMAEPDQL